MSEIAITINGKKRAVNVDEDMPAVEVHIVPTHRMEFSLGSARASRAGFGASPKRTFRSKKLQRYHQEKVREGGCALASTRGACAPQ